jgi:DNA-binding HxlR family transcriptional regulator
MRLRELGEELGGASEATLRGRLADLVALGAVAKRGGGMPYAVHNELTDVGRSLLQVVDSLDAWLARSPGGPIPLGEAKDASRTLIEGWRSRLLDALAAQPLSLTQLDDEIEDLSYPALERRTNALRSIGAIEAVAGEARTPYRIARWGQEGMAVIIAAARFEQLHLPSSEVPLTSVDVEAAVLIAGPMAQILELP